MFYKFSFKLLIINGLLLIAVAESKACGYHWIGECASSIHLRINGTLDSFTLADCPSGIPSNGLYLGNLRNLHLANARAITWESCQNNVSAVQLKYRLYEQGGGAGSFQTWDLQQDFFTFDGTYTTRYRSHAGDVDLVTGLTIGKTYVLEVYLQAEIDTIGDDFIPETTLLANRGGENYHMTFTYGGPDAAAFVAIPSIIKEPKCFGENNGAIHISVWGEQAGLFFEWSNINLNFPQQNSLVAGTYSVTVSGVNHTATQVISLGQAPPLMVGFTDILPLGCGGELGMASVDPSGGTSPYQITWEDGTTLQTNDFPSAGSYSVTVLDAHNCLTANSVVIPAAAEIVRIDSAFICVGDSILIADTWIDTAGEFTFLLPGNGNCDTLLSLFVTVSNPSLYFALLPDEISLNCTQFSVLLCAQDEGSATYTWWINGQIAASTPCFEADTLGLCSIHIQQAACEAQRDIVVYADFSVPEISFFTIPASSDTSTNGQIFMALEGGQMPYTIRWANGDTSTQIQGLLTGEYCVTVTGANGCEGTDCVDLGYSVATTDDIWPQAFGIWPNPVRDGTTVEVQTPLDFEAPSIYLLVLDAQGRRILSRHYPHNKVGKYAFEMPLNTPAGEYWVNIRGKSRQTSVKIWVIK